MSNIVNIVTFVEQSEITYTNVFLYSLIVNKKIESKYNIYLLYKDAFDDNFTIFIKKHYNNIEFYKIKLDNNLTKQNYKLYISTVKELEQLNKIIICDNNLIVKKDLTYLFKISFKSNEILGGVLDLYMTTLKRKYNSTNNRNYINISMLLVDLNKWRSLDINNKIVEYLNTNNINSQDKFIETNNIINQVLNKQIRLIDFKFNLPNIPEIQKIYHILQRDNRVNLSQFMKDVRDPIIILYINLPWSTTDYALYKDIWSMYYTQYLYETSRNNK